VKVKVKAKAKVRARARGKGAGKGEGQGKGGGDGDGGGEAPGKGGDSSNSPDKSGQSSGGPGQGGKGTSHGGDGKPNSGQGRATDADGKNGGMLKATSSEMAKQAGEIRAGTFDEEMLKDARNALDGKFKSGRAFSEKDKAKLLDGMKPLPDSGAKEHKVDRAKVNEGKVRAEFSRDGPQNKAMRTRQGEVKEDELRRAIDSRKTEVAPEYRPAVEEYYKTISDQK
jgi:hypothetical protein